MQGLKYRVFDKNGSGICRPGLRHHLSTRPDGILYRHGKFFYSDGIIIYLQKLYRDIEQKIDQIIR
jgi:hypothetical protein